MIKQTSVDRYIPNCVKLVCKGYLVLKVVKLSIKSSNVILISRSLRNIIIKYPFLTEWRLEGPSIE